MKEQVRNTNEKKKNNLFLKVFLRNKRERGEHHEYSRNLVELSAVVHCNILITVLRSHVVDLSFIAIFYAKASMWYALII